jgi:hypothetical protein
MVKGKREEIIVHCRLKKQKENVNDEIFLSVTLALALRLLLWWELFCIILNRWGQ